jgi:hypothetical protein
MPTLGKIRHKALGAFGGVFVQAKPAGQAF